MRVNRESLTRIAKESAQERAYNNPDIIAAYLTGSLVSETTDPMLGGSADIDLVLVHSSVPPVPRQIVKLTGDYHLDIGHRSKSEFRSPRELRTDPGLGYEMYDPMLLYQREKFFEFVQAGLRAGFEFHAPSLVLGRCRKLLGEARKDWVALTDQDLEQSGPEQVRQFLRSVNYAGNTIAELTGPPLPERRFLLDFPARAEQAGHPEFTGTLFNLVGAVQVDAKVLTDWLPDWKTAFLSAAENPTVDPRIHPARANYYEKAIEFLLGGDLPLSSLWPLIHTWTIAVNALDYRGIQPWKAACERLGLLGPTFGDSVATLDKYLDEIEVHLDEIAAANGLRAYLGWRGPFGKVQFVDNRGETVDKGPRLWRGIAIVGRRCENPQKRNPHIWHLALGLTQI